MPVVELERVGDPTWRLTVEAQEDPPSVQADGRASTDPNRQNSSGVLHATRTADALMITTIFSQPEGAGIGAVLVSQLARMATVMELPYIRVSAPAAPAAAPFYHAMGLDHDPNDPGYAAANALNEPERTQVLNTLSWVGNTAAVRAAADGRMVQRWAAAPQAMLLRGILPMPPITSPTFAQELFTQLTANDSEQRSWTDPEVLAALEATIDALIQTPPAPQNIPGGPQQAPTRHTDNAADGAATVGSLQAAYGALPVGAVHLTLLGETHTSQADQDRAQAVLNAVGDEVIEPALIVFERGMQHYKARGFDGPTAREDTLTQVAQADFGFGLQARQRSMVIAAYLVLALARGNQEQRTPVLLFFGDNHRDILDFFEQFAARAVNAWLMNRARTLLIEPSND